MLIDPYTWHQATIVKIVHEAPRAVSIKVELNSPYQFLCGQYAIVRVTMPNGIRLIRQYSFASSPLSNEIWFSIVAEPHGAVSEWCNFSAKLGDAVDISQPFTGSLQNFAYTNKRIALLAGGSGIVPLMSYLRYWRETNETAHVSLLYSTHSDKVCYQHELAPKPNETIILRLTDKQPRLSNLEICHAIKLSEQVLICGSRTYVGAMKELCKQLLPPENIRCEAFSL